MKRLFRLYCKLVFKELSAQMQHRASFLMLVLAQFVSSIFEIVVPLALCSRFKMVQGWKLEELALLYGTVHMGFALAEIVGRGFDRFDGIVRRGEFDRILLRPLGTLFQVSTSEVMAVKIGRFLQGLLAISWGISRLDISLCSVHGAILFFCLCGTTALFYGVFVIQATLAFYLKETLELMHIVSYGGRTVGEYPITVFNGPWRLFFTCGIPIACVIYYPINAIVHKEDTLLWMSICFPIAGFLFLAAAFQFWKLGLRRYQSTGS